MYYIALLLRLDLETSWYCCTVCITSYVQGMYTGQEHVGHFTGRMATMVTMIEITSKVSQYSVLYVSAIKYLTTVQHTQLVYVQQCVCSNSSQYSAAYHRCRRHTPHTVSHTLTVLYCRLVCSTYCTVSVSLYHSAGTSCSLRVVASVCKV